MMKSPTHPYYEIDDYYGCKCDPQVDFAEFLKEAKTESGIDAVKHQPPCVQAEELCASRRKKKKSWRIRLFSLLKAETKTAESSIANESLNTSYHINSKTKTRYFAGLVQSASSGPLLGLFHLTKKLDHNDEKKKIPYMCIQNPSSAQPYGPVYLV